jgi:PAS domain S-box-containing protein
MHPDPLLTEIENLRYRLTESLEALEAIRRGGADAVVVYGDEGEKVYILEGADQSYRVMVETINEGAASLSETGVLLWANACLAEMLRLPLASLLGNELCEWIAADDRGRYKAALELGGLQKLHLELELVAQDETRIPVLLSISPVATREQNAIAVIITDMTEHKRNIEIAAAERLAAAVIDQAGEGILVCDNQGMVIRASQSAVRLTGKNPLYYPFDTMFPLWFAGGAPGVTGQPFSVKSVLAGKTFQGAEATLVCQPDKNGKISASDVLINARPLVIPGETQLGCVIVLTDVTERKHAEAAIRRYTTQLERSNKDLEDFAFIASHDLQEPLRKIQAFGQILTEKPSLGLSTEGQDYIRRMQDAALRMGKMIEDLLTYSRVTRKTQTYAPVDLNRMMQTVVSDLDGRIQNSAAELEIGNLPTIEADAVQMNQLLQNLLGNAIKFHKPGQPPVVRVYATIAPAESASGELLRSASEQLTLVVEDEGVGFDMQFVDRIFQPFQRLHGRSAYEGSGIGLSVCYRIVERHHGTIKAEGEVGKGARFTVTLPVSQGG